MPSGHLELQRSWKVVIVSPVRWTASHRNYQVADAHQRVHRWLLSR